MSLTTVNTERYAQCIAASRRVRWDIDRDVIRARRLDLSKPFLPEGLSRIGRLEFLTPTERVRLSQVQGRTYANMFGLVERFIGIQMLSCSRRHWFGDQVALEALVRFSDEELKHQELFRRIERLAADGMAPGYAFAPTANAVASQVLEASTWAVLALTCHIELFTQVHYRQSIEPSADIAELYRDVFRYHWQEESQHVILDELEWACENARLTPRARDAAVDDLIALVGAIDHILQQQATADAHYFAHSNPRAFSTTEAERIAAGVLDAYRWQYIVSGMQVPRFRQTLIDMTTPAQQQRIQAALLPLTN
ncbi:hypothetical protein [Hydrogenophaga palleronii]|uniref:hypothetical protein n=1 Tax=Hydrogenophaga palleronii TaxID=65655 RepID=UPI000825C732|nr:hypothetical protein [Hydrogenophaga palleronii]